VAAEPALVDAAVRRAVKGQAQVFELVTVSNMCHSGLSSSVLPRAALTPPWAAPVWERVG
jgi:hypothetical protein